MKNFFKTASLIVLVALASCKDDGSESSQDAKTKMLTATSWGQAQVTHSDGDLSDQYTDFVILFTSTESAEFDGSFVISNGGNAFSESAGQWKFNDDQTKIIFDSGKEIDITLDESHLQLDFTVPDPGGRTAGLSGHFTFDLQPM
jgi:hypothetical protein